MIIYQKTINSRYWNDVLLGGAGRLIGNQCSRPAGMHMRSPPADSHRNLPGKIHQTLVLVQWKVPPFYLSFTNEMINTFNLEQNLLTFPSERDILTRGVGVLVRWKMNGRTVVAEPVPESVCMQLPFQLTGWAGEMGSGHPSSTAGGREPPHAQGPAGSMVPQTTSAHSPEGNKQHDVSAPKDSTTRPRVAPRAATEWGQELSTNVSWPWPPWYLLPPQRNRKQQGANESQAPKLVPLHHEDVTANCFEPVEPDLADLCWSSFVREIFLVLQFSFSN